MTTTAVRLHQENETRLLSLQVTDTRAQTREVMRAIAESRLQRVQQMLAQLNADRLNAEQSNAEQRNN